MENSSNLASPDDDAGQRLVGDEKNGSKDKNVEVKYITPDSHNGDAKIDIENIKSAFAGMGKDELMKFANDPFWVKTRWVLFILFWLVWVAMLAGAIAIIVLAPKCSAPSPREWWEQSPLYQVDVRNFKDGGDPQTGVGNLKGLTLKLDYLKSLGVKTVVVSNVLKSTNPVNKLDLLDGSVEDYKNVSSQIGTVDDFKELAKAAREKGLYLLLSFIPNHSSDKHPWFVKSAARDSEFADYYVWAPKKKFEDDGTTPIPPNNWKSIKGGSAWKWHEGRKEFYLHQFGESQPDFNFRNQHVVDYFKDVMKFWLNNGISGFHLDKVQYLLEDLEFRDEQPANKNTGATHDSYEFYSHKQTSDLPELANILQQWNQIPANSSGILSVTGVRPSTDSLAKNVSVGQLLVRPQYLNSPLSARDLNTLIDTTLKSSSWPTWEFTSKPENMEDLASGLMLISMLLPGTPITHSGAELGLLQQGLMPWNESTYGGFSTVEPWRPVDQNALNNSVQVQEKTPDSTLKLYKQLVEIRNNPAIMYGETHAEVLNNGTIFAFTRIKAGNPGYLVVFNVGNGWETVNVNNIKKVPDEVSVSARTFDLAKNITMKSKLGSSALSLNPYSAVVLQFVPSSED